MRLLLSRSRLPALAVLAAAAAAVPLVIAAPTSVAEIPAAAATQGWERADLVFSDKFDGTELDPRWNEYDGVGHAGNGIRSPEQISVRDGALRIDGTVDGTTGGMAADTGQQYGRWEARARYGAGTSAYHQVLILWPDAEDFPVGGEVDFSEVSDPERQELAFFLHYGENNDQVTASTQVDMTQWHTYAVEWTPESIVGYVDGVEFFRSDDPSIFPPRPMHPTIQLDWFPDDGAAGEGWMEVDWYRQYTL